MHLGKKLYKNQEGKQLIRAENLRIVDIEINASSPLFTILPTYLNFLIPEIEN